MEAMILAAITALVASVNVVSDFLKRLFKVDKRWFNELLSWLVAIGATYAAWAMGKMPTFFEPEWLCVLVEGIFVGMVANFTYGYEWVKKILDFIFSFIDGKWYDKVEVKKE